MCIPCVPPILQPAAQPLRRHHTQQHHRQLPTVLTAAAAGSASPGVAAAAAAEEPSRGGALKITTYVFLWCAAGGIQLWTPVWSTAAARWPSTTALWVHQHARRAEHAAHAMRDAAFQGMPGMRCRHACSRRPRAAAAFPLQVCIQHCVQHPEQVHPQHLPSTLVSGHVPTE